MKKIVILVSIIIANNMFAQEVMTPELLLELGRVSPLGITKDGKNLIYNVSTPNMKENKLETKTYTVPINGGISTLIEDYKSLLADKNISPDQKYILFHKKVPINKILGKDIYSDLTKSTAYVYNELDYRHWDTDNQGKFNHVFYRENKEKSKGIDIMEDEPYYSPQMPFGGDEDYIWSPDGKNILYVSLKKQNK